MDSWVECTAGPKVDGVADPEESAGRDSPAGSATMVAVAVDRVAPWDMAVVDGAIASGEW